MSNVDIKQLFEAGAHFGHKTARWNPRMAQYIYGKKDGVHIIDLEKTVAQIEAAQNFVESVAERGRQVLFVGTKQQAKEVTAEGATAAGMPYVTERWLGGMLTNQTTVVAQIKKLKLLEKRMASGELASRYNKLEVQHFQEEINVLNTRYGGIKDMHGKPGVLVVLDAVSDRNAINEAIKLNIPVVAVCDTNADPKGIDYVIPANDDAISTLKLVAGYLAEAAKAGKEKSAKVAEERKAAKGDK